MLLSYRRTGGHQPSDFETLDVEEDCSFRMWRTIARATNPPTPIGSFAGELPGTDLEALRADIETTGKAGNLELPMPPGSAVEQVRIAGATATLPHSGEQEGAWGGFVTRCRGLLVSLTEQPRAALALRLLEEGRAAELVHLGTEPLLLDPSTIAVRTVLWKGYEQLGSWEWRASGEPSDAEAGPGWSMPLPFDHGLEQTETARLAAYVDVQVFAGEDEGWLVCSLQTPHPAEQRS
jgi:hypothetical protein